MLAINIDTPHELINGMEAALRRYSSELGNTPKVAIRRGTLVFIKSIRARTIVAKRRVPSSAVTRYRDKGPHYITPKGHKQKSLPRWSIVRREGCPARRVYVHAAETKAEARRMFGAIKNWGLAKKSWGLFMTHLFNRPNPAGDNARAKIRSGMTSGHIRETKTNGVSFVEALLVNHLPYIRKATPSSAINAALVAAAKSINHQIEKGLAKARKELT